MMVMKNYLLLKVIESTKNQIKIKFLEQNSQFINKI